ncbi:MAG: ATP-binding cassette domain-containing protein, partial [Rhodospirillales bacterium]|nr:ATP-binding cassette domain-containing protein [Rhodospirillales bacterium]
MTNYLEVRNLSKRFGDFSALGDVSLDVVEGEFVCFLGPSGCGKTTLLRCFNRINERYANVTTSGEVRIHGRNIYDEDVDLIELRKDVGMVFQRPNPLPISIRDNVLYGYRLHT